MKLTREFTGCLLAAAAACLFFVGGVFDSFAGPLASFFCAAPVLWAAYRFGPGTAAAASALAGAGIMPLASLPASLSFLAGNALPGMLMGLCFRGGRGSIVTALCGTLAALFLSSAGSILYYAAAGLDPRIFLRYQLGDMLREAAYSMEALSGVPVGADTLLPPWLMTILPSLVFITLFVQNSLNLFLVRLAAARLYRVREALPDVSGFAVPEKTVWVLIPALAGQWIPVPVLRTAAVNLAILILFFYLVQGLSILAHFTRQAKASRPLFMVCVIAFLLQPYLLAVPLIAGLLDFRVGFRARWPRPSSSS